jgi:hypothetical protein
MYESENLARWRRFAAVTRIECVLHLLSSGSVDFKPKTMRALRRRKLLVARFVMSFVDFDLLS